MPYANPDRQRASWADAQARRRAKAKANAERAALADRYAAALARIRDAATVEQAREVARQAMEGSDE